MLSITCRISEATLCALCLRFEKAYASATPRLRGSHPLRPLREIGSLAILLIVAGCGSNHSVTASSSPVTKKLTATPFALKVIAAARDQLDDGTGYDGKYVKIGYPNGDPPKEIGVCTDVVVRAFRPAGYDLQKLIHDDMGVAWSSYPRYMGLPTRDTNIDHRRVPNQRVYFGRHAKSLPITLGDPKDWKPGDIVTWKIFGRLDHVGLLSDTPNEYGFPLVIHNAGAGPREEDILSLTTWKINGHFRFPKPE